MQVWGNIQIVWRHSMYLCTQNNTEDISHQFWHQIPHSHHATQCDANKYRSGSNRSQGTVQGQKRAPTPTLHCAAQHLNGFIKVNSNVRTMKTVFASAPFSCFNLNQRKCICALHCLYIKKKTSNFGDGQKVVPVCTEPWY